MALIDFTGFEDQENNTLGSFFTNVSNVSYCDYSTVTRYNMGKSFYNSSTSLITYYKDLYKDCDEVTVGCAIKRGLSDGQGYPRCHIQFFTGSYVQCSLYMSRYGMFLERYSGVNLASYVDKSWNYNTWNYVEVKCSLGNGDGYMVARLNGIEVMNISDIDNVYNATVYTISQVRLYMEYSYIDDIYILDNTGTENTDFLGDVVCYMSFPTANGTTNDGTASSGSNYECVDEEIVDDTDYITLDTIGQVELYTIGDLPTTTNAKTIHGVKVQSRMQKTDSDAHNVNNIVYVNSTTYNGTGVYLPIGYAYYYDIWELNPDTSLAWTETEVNSLESGIVVNA